VVETPTSRGRRIGVAGRAAARGDVRRERGPGNIGEIELKIDLVGLAADGQPHQRDRVIGLGHRGNERHVSGYKSRGVNSAWGIMVICELNLPQLRRRKPGGVGAKAQLGFAKDIIGYHQGNGPRIGIAKHWTGGGVPIVCAAVAGKYQGALSIYKLVEVPLAGSESGRHPTFYRQYGDVFGWGCGVVIAAAGAQRLNLRRGRKAAPSGKAARK